MAPRQATYAGSVGTDGERERGRGNEREIKRESQEREERVQWRKKEERIMTEERDEKRRTGGHRCSARLDFRSAFFLKKFQHL